MFVPCPHHDLQLIMYRKAFEGQVGEEIVSRDKYIAAEHENGASFFQED